MAVSCKLYLLLGASAVLAGLSGPRQVVLDNTNGSTESGLLVWGDFQPAVSQLPVSFTGIYDGKISVGKVSELPNGPNQAVAFTVGRPPAIGSRVKWNSSPSVHIKYPDVYELPVKIWVLHTPTNCGLACMQTSLGGFLIWANGVLERERAGLRLIPSSGDWISNETQNKAAPVKRYRTFTSDEPDDCDAQALADLAAQLKENQAINLYVVKTVDGKTTRGYKCHEAPDLAFAGSRASWGTMLHEIGHAFDLSHIDGNSAFNEENVMHSASDVRGYFSEGQVFRMHFSEDSILNVTFQKRKAEQRWCIGSGVKKDLPCPPLETRLWPEK